MVLRYCLFDLRNYGAQSRDKTKKDEKLLHRAEDCRIFAAGRQLGIGLRRDACSFLHTHATGDREDNVG